MMKVLAIALVLSMCSASMALARQFPTPDGHVVHTRRAPVIMHRIVPPYKGVHVYRRGR